MTTRLEAHKAWTGGIDDLVEVTNGVLPAMLRSEIEPMNVRLVRDYISRGLLGETGKTGRELVFDYSNLLRLVVTRLLLADGWSLGKITEFLDLSSPAEIEAVLPGSRNPALEALNRMRAEAAPAASASQPAPPPIAPLARAARTSSMQFELQSALRRLGLPEGAPATEELTLIAIAPWFQVLITTDRLPRLTIDESEELGRAVAASLIRIVAKRGKSNDRR